MRLLMATALLASLVCNPVSAAENGEQEAGGWYLGAGAGVQTLESWDAGSQAVLTLGRKLAYRHPDTPRSSVALEFELSQSTDPVSQRRDGLRQETDLTTAGIYLANNTYITERVFYRARLGAVYRHLDPEDGSNRNQGRIGFGLGAGVAVTRRLELVADAGLQYWGDTPMLFTGTLSARYNF